MLEQRFTQPAGWQWRDKVETRSGQYIRMGWVIPEGAKALVAILPGLSEYGEKYFEMARDLVVRGYAVACVDWRGQGLSWRQDDKNKRYHDNFINDVEDAHVFLKTIPVPATMPRILLAHSMGAHIGVRLMHDHPGMFRCAVLTAPMFAINLPGKIDPILRAVAYAGVKLGMAESYLPGGQAWTETAFHNNIKLLTSDPARAGIQFYWMSCFPDLRMGGLTFSWLVAALESTRLTCNRQWLSGITTSCLIFKSGRDQIVSNRAIRAAAKAMPHADLVEIDGALHEVMLEQDIYRDQFWAAFDAFIAKHL